IRDPASQIRVRHATQIGKTRVLNLCRFSLHTAPQGQAGQARTKEQQRGGLRHWAEVRVKAHVATSREVDRSLRKQRVGSGMYEAVRSGTRESAGAKRHPTF